MLSRTTLLACPGCTRHVFPTDPVCPACGERLRGTDGSVARTQVALAMGLGAVFSIAGIGCGDSDSSSGTGGGGGATTATSTSNSTASSTTKATTTQTTGMMSAVSTYGTGPSGCDDGTPDTLDSQICSDCIDCAIAGNCSDELATFQADPDAQSFNDCITLCEDTACEDACAGMYPNAAAAFYAVLSCTVCFECPNNCDAAANCQ